MRKLAMADYSYNINRDRKRLHIVDLNKGEMSVTNDAEAVLTEIAEETKEDLRRFRITYIDSYGSLGSLDVNEALLGIFGKVTDADTVYVASLLKKLN